MSEERLCGLVKQEDNWKAENTINTYEVRDNEH